MKVSEEVRKEVFNWCENRNNNQSRISLWEVLHNTSVGSWNEASFLYASWVKSKYIKVDDILFGDDSTIVEDIKKSDEEE